MMKTYHILAPFQMTGGGVWHAIDLATRFIKAGHSVQLWSPLPLNQQFAAQYKIKLIQPYRGDIPKGDHLFIVGADTSIGIWYDHSAFEEITLICNQHAPRMFTECLHRLSRQGRIPINISYVSNALKILTGLPGVVKPSAWDSQRFFSQAGITDPPDIMKKPTNSRFTIGRSSRDTIVKHHFRDPALYRSFADIGCDIRLLGATCLNPWLKNHPSIQLLDEQLQRYVPKFLLGLDCFFYRTSLNWPEAFGLVVIEAMACGVAVVVHASCGSAEIIDQGKNGYVFEEEAEAIEIVMALKNNKDLQSYIGDNAQKTIAGLY